MLSAVRFCRAGERNGPTVDPLALRAARDIPLLLSQGTSREAVATVRELGRLPYSRSSFERVGHVLSEAYVSQHQRVDQLLIEATRCHARYVRSAPHSIA